MGHIVKRKNGWAIKYDAMNSTREKRRIKTLSGFNTKREAQEALKIVESRMQLGLIKENQFDTIGDVISHWFKEKVLKRNAPGTVEFYENYIRNFIEPDLAAYKLSSLKAGMITEYYDELLDNGHSTSTIDKLHKTLRAAFYYCYQQEYIQDKFMDRIKSPQKVKNTKKIKYWTPEELKQALPHFISTEIYFHMFMSLHLGLRAGEVCALHISDLDFQNNIITISHSVDQVTGEIRGKYIKKLSHNTLLKDTKASDIRTLPMTTVVRKELMKRIILINEYKTRKSYNHNFDGFLSVYENGKLITNQRVTRIFTRELTKLRAINPSIPQITFHGLRHSCASWLYSSNVDLKTIQVILGHSDIKITSEIYTHLNLDQKKEALDKLRLV